MCKKWMCLTFFVVALGLVPGNAAFAASLLSDPDLAGWWTFDEGAGAVAADLSANGNDATVFGDAAWVPGFYGTALNFDGSDDYVGTELSLLDNVEDFTMAGWVMARNPTGSRIGLFGQNDLIEMGFNGGGASVWTSARIARPSDRPGPR